MQDAEPCPTPTFFAPVNVGTSLQACRSFGTSITPKSLGGLPDPAAAYAPCGSYSLVLPKTNPLLPIGRLAFSSEGGLIKLLEADGSDQDSSSRDELTIRDINDT
jgi:hypothetical protein